MTLAAAVEEAYASGDEFGVTVDAFEIDHPGLDAPIYGVRGFDRPAGAGDVVLALPLVEGGPLIDHWLCAFSLVRAGDDHDGPTDGKVSIDAVSGELYPFLKAMLGYAEAATITFRQYQVDPARVSQADAPDLDPGSIRCTVAGITGPDELIEGMQLSNVDLNETTATGDIAWPDGRKQNVPTGAYAFFTREEYPALFS